MSRRAPTRVQLTHEAAELRAQVAQLEAALRAREQSARLFRDIEIVDSVHDAIIIVDPATRILLWNRAAEEIYGWRADEALGRPLGELMLTRYTGAETRESAMATLQRQSYWRGEVTQRHRDGHDLAIESAIQLVRDAHGAISALVGVNRDISERKRAEIRRQVLIEASLLLAHSLDYEAALANIARVAVPAFADSCFIHLVGDDGRIHRTTALHRDPAKHALLAELGLRYPIESQEQHPVYQVIRAGRAASYTAATLLAALERTARDAEHLALLRELLPTTHISAPIRGHTRILGALSFSLHDPRRRYDANDLALAEELALRTAFAIEHAKLYAELRQALQSADDALALLDSLLSTAQVGLGFVDSELRYRRMNQFLAELSGLPIEQHLGHTIGELFPQIAPIIEPRFRHVLATGQPLTDVETTGRLPPDSPTDRHWVSSYYPARRPNGEILGVGVVVIDITARKQAEEERLTFERKLLETQKLESIGVLAGGIAHDFNNLLVSILGHADLALMDLAPEAPARASIAHIQLAGQRAADLTRQLLAYVGRGRLATQPTDMNAVIEEMAHLLQAAIAKHIVLRFALEPHLPLIEADTTQMRQIIMNLVVNASEAIGAQGGVITIASGSVWADAAYLRETYRAPDLPAGRYIGIEIADTGVGMDAATQARIFEPFFSTKFSGRGLGLAAVQGIVRRHRGALRVYSEPERGTTFKLLLPSANLAAGAPDPPQAASPWVGSGTILLVDDEADVRATIEAMLGRFGFTVLSATNGCEGVELYRRAAAAITCVLLDMTMPQMGGGEAFRQIRRIDQQAKVILMSGYTEEDTVSQFAGKGLAGFLQKPFSPHELQAKIRGLG